MPNHVTNKLVVVGVDAKSILDSLKSDDSEFDFNKVIQMPEELGDTTYPSQERNPKLTRKYGFDNWYEWALHNWGTKWNAYDITRVSDNEVKFDTAWSCASNIVQELSKQHQDQNFVLTFADEDIGRNCGILTFKDGKRLSFEDKSIGKLESKEATIRWALTVKYGSDDSYEEYLS